MPPETRQMTTPTTTPPQIHPWNHPRDGGPHAPHLLAFFRRLRSPQPPARTTKPGTIARVRLSLIVQNLVVVGARGFEPPTSCSRRNSFNPDVVSFQALAWHAKAANRPDMHPSARQNARQLGAPELQWMPSNSHSPLPTTSSTFFPFNLCTQRVGASPGFRVARVALPSGLTVMSVLMERPRDELREFGGREAELPPLVLQAVHHVGHGELVPLLEVHPGDPTGPGVVEGQDGLPGDQRRQDVRQPGPPAWAPGRTSTWANGLWDYPPAATD